MSMTKRFLEKRIDERIIEVKQEIEEHTCRISVAPCECKYLFEDLEALESGVWVW